MGSVVVSQFVTVDGVIEDPGGAEGFDRGGWAFRFDRGEDGNTFKLDEVMAADALLLGRVTYEGFAAAWPDRKDEAGFADKFNAMPKYVVSSTLENPSWNNSHVIKPDDVTGSINAIKEDGAGGRRRGPRAVCPRRSCRRPRAARTPTRCRWTRLRGSARH